MGYNHIMQTLLHLRKSRQNTMRYGSLSHAEKEGNLIKMQNIAVVHWGGDGSTESNEKL